jgi:uncharacterized membrane protein YphA (DoxX/SURF4 family)
MLYALTLGLLLGYKIQKLFQFKFFYKLKRISVDHYFPLLKKINSVAYKELIKVSLIDFAYLILLVISLFNFNLYFAFVLISLLAIETWIFRLTKNNFVRKYFYFTNIIFSMIFLSLAIINAVSYKVDGIELIKNLLNLI